MNEKPEQESEKTKTDETWIGGRYGQGIRRRPRPYEIFMEEEGIPVYHGLGVYDSRQLAMAPWKRMGGRGSFIELDGQAGYFGLYAVEVPARGELNAERHMHEEVFYVVEGYGSTEVWREGSSKKLTFEWQGGSMFAIPLNVWHRMVNAGSSPALMVASTSAPNVMDTFPSRNYIFDNSYEFYDRYDESEDYFKPQETEGEGRLATLRSNLVPDVATAKVARVNIRAPGESHLRLNMAGNTFLTHGIFEYPSGRYSTCHAHPAGRILFCLSGKGYSLNWLLKLGKRPWEAGYGHLVNRQDYIPGGMVTAAGGTGEWFHGHFSVSKEPLRVMRIGTIQNITPEEGEVVKLPDGREFLYSGWHEVRYPEEDPQVRKDYEESIKKEGAEFTMPESVYQQKP
ncbi:MAG: cupin domain-containing protein [Dehalococcoidales bacterium]|nr:cupin domain-containing protein [Dehalococcoidales bacterium]